MQVHVTLPDDNEQEPEGLRGAKVQDDSDTGAGVTISSPEFQTEDYLADAEPYASEQEMQAALNAPGDDLGSLRINRDPEYRAQVEARVAASMETSGVFGKRTGFQGPQTPGEAEGLAEPPKDGKIGKPGKPAARVKPFPTTEAMVAAMDDPRFRNDPQYRAVVEARTLAM